MFNFMRFPTGANIGILSGNSDCTVLSLIRDEFFKRATGKYARGHCFETIPLLFLYILECDYTEDSTFLREKCTDLWF